jgi:protein SCO1
MRSHCFFQIATLVCSIYAVGGDALAHQGRGQTLHESQTAKRAPDDYQPPEPARLGGPFELTDHTSRAVTHETFRGRWMVLFFGFAGCREACPVGLDRLGAALEELGSDADKLQPLFIDLDFGPPDREALAQFVGNFDKRILGLNGTRAQIYNILRDYKVRRELKHHAAGSKETGPRVDHSTYFYVVDPSGKTRSYFYHTLSATEMAAHLRAYVAQP